MTTDPLAALREAVGESARRGYATVVVARDDLERILATPPAIDPEAERAYVNNYISGRDAALRSALIARVGDAVGRNAAADIVDAAWRAALAATPPAIEQEDHYLGIYVPDSVVPEAIDPERLARALARAEVGCIGFGGFKHGPGNDLTSHRRDAAAIIAAYEAEEPKP